MTTPQDLRTIRARAGEIDARRAAARHVGQSADRAVTATVTGQGKLVGLRIEDAALDGAHLHELGPSVVEAVRAARGAAHEESVPELSALFGLRPLPLPEPVPEWAQGAVEQVRHQPVTTQTPQRRTADVETGHEESFEELDFLSDDEADGRW